MVRSLALSLVFIFTFFSSTAMAGETIVNLWQSNRQLVAVPRAIAVDNSNGSVWVADYGAGEIIHLASDGTTVLATVSGLAFGSPQASAIAVNPSNGSAWVADMQNDRVLNISSSGTILRTITSLSYPSSVAVNTSDDSVWIADRANGRVLNVSAAGTILANIGDFYAPNAIAYDQTRNLCWVTSSTNASHPETLNRLSWNGSSWVKTTSSIIGSSSLGICVNESNGHVWVADTYSRNVVRLDSSGAQLSVTTLPYNPMKVAVNSSSGEAWVAYKYPLDYVTRFNSSGGVVSDIHGFDAAESIAVNQSTGDVWVADTNNGQIVQLDSTGIEEWRSALGVREPRAISANPLDGSAWVADFGLQRIIQLGSNGDVLNRAVARTYQTYSTISVAVDGGDGSVWHNDFSLSAAKYYLKHIASDGSPLHTLDLGGNPTDFVVVNSGNGDCWRINGSWLFGYTNQAVNKANRYVGIPIKSASTNSADGTVWVAAYDAANGGHVIHYPSGSSGGALWDGTGFTEPSCVSVYSADGSVWVAQPSTNEVIHLAADGSESWRGDTFSGPSLLAVDQSDGSLWVAGTTVKTLYHLAASGALLSSASYTLPGTIVAISVDSGDGSVWLASDQGVAHYMANSSPTAIDDTLSTYANVPASGVLGATDPEDEPLTFSIVSDGSNGHVSITDDETGDFTYTPNALYSGADSFEFQVFDGLNYSNIGTVTVNILANDPPVAAADSAVVMENSSVNIPILANDYDPDGVTITLLSITQPAHGQNVLEADDTVTYTPNTGYSGADTFTYTILDNRGASATGTVSITINPLPRPPQAMNDSATTYEDVPLPISVLANDSDPDGDPLTITAVTQPAHGTSAINGASVTYTPSADFSGTDSFTYTISDGTHTATATVNVTVIAVDDSPMEVTASIYATGFDAPISVSVNPTDGSVWVANYGSGQIVHLAQNGSEMWRGTSFHTPRSVSVNPNDGSCWVADEGLSRVTHLASNGTTMWSGTSFDHPEAVSVNAADNSVWVADTRNNQVVHLRVDGAELSRSAFTSPQSVSVNPNDGSCWVAGTSTPQIAHLAEDGSELWSGGTLSGPLSVSVNPVDGSCWVIDHTAYKVAHYAADGTELWKGGTGLYLPKSVSVNSTDGSSWVANTWNNEVMHLAADGSELWRGADFSRPASVSVNSTDGSCWVADTNNNRVVHLLLSPVNQPPVASDDSISTNEDVATSGSLSANDPEDDPMVYSIVSNGTLGTAIITDPLTGAFTYTPNPDANGTDTFTFKVNDGEDDSNVATVTVNIAPINDPPVAGDDIVTTPEDTPILIRILDNDTDVDAGDTLSLYRLWVHGGAAGSMGNNGDGTLTYYPKANWTGTDDWGFYDVSDGHGGTDRADLIIIVTPVNDPPVAVDDSATTSEDTSVLIDVLANDSDVEGPLSVIQASQPSHGSVVLVGDTSITYTPAPNYNGTDAFTYMVRDLDGVTATATVSVTIAPVNDPPVATDDSVVTDEDTAVVIAVLANDTDVDGDDLTISTQLGYFVPPTHGQAIINADGTITYTPDANYAGSDSFQYCVEDPSGLRSGMATVSITVNPVNDPPVAVDDSATVGEDRSVIIGVLMNDTDVDDGALTVSVATPPANGTLTVNPNNSITYTPATNYFGTDSFTYTASDAAGATATATVSVTVAPEDDPPVANDDTADTPEDTPVAVSVLANDDEVDGEMLSVVGITQPAHGVATHNANDTVTYAPAQDYSGSDSFTYTITDGHTTQTATVQITVTPVNDPPTAGDDTATTDEDTAVTVIVLANDSDVDSPSLSVSQISQPAHGSTVINADNTVTYTPNLNYNGADTFTYTADDGSGGTATATVTITITPVNDPPVAVDDIVTTPEDTPILIRILDNDTDVDAGDTLSFYRLLVRAGAAGAMGNNGDGTLTYYPPANWSGTTHWGYYDVRDGSGATDRASLIITVTPVNDPPVAGDDSLTIAEDTTSIMSANWLLLNDSDPDGETPTVIGCTQPSNGTATFNAVGSITYTPAPDYFGADSLTYTISDGYGETATGTVNITVMPFPDPPVAVDDDATTAEDTAVIIYVLDNDYDVDGESLSLMASGLGQPAHGTVVRTTPTYVTYTPDPNYHGPDSFTYMVSDGHGGSDEGAVSVTVTPVSDPPVLNPIGDKSIDEGQELTFTLEADDPDVGDTLTYSATLPLPSGASLNSTTGVFVWLPDFLQSGNYTIEFEVTDGTFTDSETINIEVVDVNRPPVADANGPYTMEVAEPIHLDGSGSVDPDAPLDHIVTYDWDMNMDGVYEKTTSDAVCVVFWDDLYAWRSGNIVIGQPFDIRLRVTDSNGATDTAVTTVTVQNTAPIADAGGPYTTTFDNGIALDASGSVDPDSQCGDSIVEYKWDIDNDGTYEFTDILPSRTLTWTDIESLVCGGTVVLEQPYTVALQVTDENGATDTASTTLTVLNTAPVAAFTYTPADPTTNDTIPFIDASSDIDGTVTTWEWDFGDTSTSTEQNPSHQYTAPGTYTATLTVTDSNGATDVISYDITVAQGGNTLPGSDVVVDLGDGMSITFFEVTSAGDTTVTTSTTPPFGPPDGFRFLGTYYDISTTAGYTPPVTIAIPYNDADVPGGEARETELKIFHSDGSGGWTDVTLSVDTANNIIYAQVTSFSWFAIGWPTYDWLGFLPPVEGAERPFKQGSTIPFKFRIAKDGQPQPEAFATIHIYYLADGAPDLEPAVVSTAAGDLGSVFRYSADEDLFIFNLSTKDPSYLDYYTYRAEAWLDDGTKHAIIFSLK